MAKKILIISSIVFFIALATIVVQKVFLSGSKEQGNLAVENETVGENDEESPAADSKGDPQKIRKLSENRIKGATLAPGKAQILFYDNQKFLQANFEGEVKESAGAYPFKLIRSIEWNSKKTQALINDGSTYYLYKLEDNSATPLKNNLDIAVWDALGNQIVYKYFDPKTKNRSIEISAPLSSEWKVLVDKLPYQKVDFAPEPKGEKVCFYPSPNSNAGGKFECIDPSGDNRSVVQEGQYGVDYLWSPDGKKLLVSYAQTRAGNRLVLATMNAGGGELKGLNFFTSVKKCVWSSDSEHVFCGGMTGAPPQAVLPNDWQDDKYFSSDTFWKINTKDGKKTRLLELDETPGELDGINFFLDQGEQFLFFTEKRSENLYRIKL